MTDKRKEYERLWYTFDKELPKQCANCCATDDLVIHHIVPLSAGGNNVIRNLVRLCSKCHDKVHNFADRKTSATEGYLSKARRGEWASGTPPLGYVLIDGNVEIDAKDAEIVRLIFNLRYRNEMSAIYIAKILNAMAIPTIRGAKGWTHATIRKILNNRAYFGEYVYRGTNYGDILPHILDEEVSELIDTFNDKYAKTRMITKCIIHIDGEAVS